MMYEMYNDTVVNITQCCSTVKALPGTFTEITGKMHIMFFLPGMLIRNGGDLLCHLWKRFTENEAKQKESREERWRISFLHYSLSTWIQLFKPLEVSLKWVNKSFLFCKPLWVIHTNERILTKAEIVTDSRYFCILHSSRLHTSHNIN